MTRVAAHSGPYLVDDSSDIAFRAVRPACRLAVFVSGGPDLWGMMSAAAGVKSALGPVGGPVGGPAAGPAAENAFSIPDLVARATGGTDGWPGLDPFAALSALKGPGLTGEAADLALTTGQALRGGGLPGDIEALLPFVGSVHSDVGGTAGRVIEALGNKDPMGAIGALFRGLADVPGVGPVLGAIGGVLDGSAWDIQDVILKLTGGGR